VQWPDGRRAFATNSVTVSANGPPVLSQARSLPSGGFAFVLSGTPAAGYVIQTSTDLATWTPVATNTLPASGAMLITDQAVSQRSNADIARKRSTSLRP
jgi:hypothetical protein